MELIIRQDTLVLFTVSIYINKVLSFQEMLESPSLSKIS